MDEHDVTDVDPPRGAAGAVRARRPGARLAGERDGHGQRARGGAAARRRHGPGRLRVLDRRRWRPTPSTRARSTASSSSPTRAPPAGYFADFGVLVGRAAPAHDLRPRPRPGADLGADRGDGRRRAGRGVRRSRSAARCSSSTRRTPARRSCARARPRAEGASVHNLDGPVATVEEIVAAIEAAEPGGARSPTAGTRCRSRRRSTRRSFTELSAARPRGRSTEGVAESIAAVQGGVSTAPSDAEPTDAA